MNAPLKRALLPCLLLRLSGPAISAEAVDKMPPKAREPVGGKQHLPAHKLVSEQARQREAGTRLAGRGAALARNCRPASRSSG